MAKTSIYPLIVPGQRFAQWLVLSHHGLMQGHRSFLCRCDCGTERIVWESSLQKQTSKSCGCTQLSVKIGHRYGRLVILQEAGRTPQRKRLLLCQCDCGQQVTVVSGSLQSNLTRSCGCWQKEVVAQFTKTHGATVNRTATREYRIWAGIKTRTTNPNNPSFRYYGGRGITMCDRWLNSFENFLADVSPMPGPQYSIDRYPNRNGNYEPSNVRWATPKEQAKNRNPRSHSSTKGAI
mgnify:CR=1 FL=1